MVCPLSYMPKVNVKMQSLWDTSRSCYNPTTNTAFNGEVLINTKQVTMCDNLDTLGNYQDKNMLGNMGFLLQTIKDTNITYILGRMFGTIDTTGLPTPIIVQMNAPHIVYGTPFESLLMVRAFVGEISTLVSLHHIAARLLDTVYMGLYTVDRKQWVAMLPIYRFNELHNFNVDVNDILKKCEGHLTV